MKNLKKEQKLIISIIVALSLITLLFVIIYKINNFRNNKIPKLNYDSLEINELNNYISSLYESADENTKISYKKYDEENYISLVFKITFLNKNGYDAKKYIVSVVDKNKLSVLSKEDIAVLFNYDLSYINGKVKLKLREFYNNEVKSKYIDSTKCNFECYLNDYRKIEDIEDFYYLSIEKGKLVAYLKLNNNIYDKDIKYFNNLKNPERLVIN